jgi:hypothetical protein
LRESRGRLTGGASKEEGNVKRITVMLVAMLAFAGVFAGPAGARHTLAHRVSVLETKVSNLQTKVNNLYKFTHNCIAWDWVALASYGDANGTFGYVYDDDGAGPVPPFYTSSIDYASLEDSQFVVAAVNPDCVSAIRARTSALRASVAALSGTQPRRARLP